MSCGSEQGKSDNFDARQVAMHNRQKQKRQPLPLDSEMHVTSQELDTLPGSEAPTNFAAPPKIKPPGFMLLLFVIVEEQSN